MNKKGLYKYIKVLSRRIYRPVKPIVSPLAKNIRLWQVLGVVLLVMVMGSLWSGWVVKSTERASFWPWSSRSHSEMALFWFEAGDEEKALEELEMANKLLLVKTSQAKESLRKAEEKVTEPKRIKEEIKSWEKVIEEKPYFRDVLLRLAILNFQIYENEKAVDYLLRAEYLDPSNEEIKEVKEVISSLF